MPSYLALASWTEQGIQDLKSLPERIDAYKETVKTAGGRVIFFYTLMGEYDFMTLYEVADDETAARLALEVARMGNTHSETHRAFTEDETRALIASLQ
jgi:uncharacterized protein with GYD domain